MYRLGIEAILGIRRVAGGLRIDPRLPREWPGFKATYRFEGTLYHITVERGPETADHDDSGSAHTRLDDIDLPEGIIPLRADGQEHHVHVQIQNGKS
jgi:cyclic beta-1,2-glucan synthetase